MNRHFTNGFGYLTNLHDVSRTNLVVRYVKNYNSNCKKFTNIFFRGYSFERENYKSLYLKQILFQQKKYQLNCHIDIITVVHQCI